MNDPKDICQNPECGHEQSDHHLYHGCLLKNNEGNYSCKCNNFVAQTNKKENNK